MKRRLRIKQRKQWWEDFTQAWKSIGWWYREYNYYKNKGYKVILTEKGIVIAHPNAISYSDGI